MSKKYRAVAEKVMNDKINVGIDLGSRLAKIIVLQDKKIIHFGVRDTGVNPLSTSRQLFAAALAELRLSEKDVKNVFSTGYGRNVVPFAAKRISEISCHARGVHYLHAATRTVIDIGGQDSKVILLGSGGKVQDFAMNDKCAAGTGRFLEVTANILEITVEDLAEMALDAKEDIDISSTCVVFAESEIIGLIAAGRKSADIVKAVHRSIARRIKNLIAQVAWQQPVVFTGGVACNSGMKNAIAETLGENVIVPENSLQTGALGAALYAAEYI